MMDSSARPIGSLYRGVPGRWRPSTFIRHCEYLYSEVSAAILLAGFHALSGFGTGFEGRRSAVQGQQCVCKLVKEMY